MLIFLEYVPGGSIASLLAKFGAFSEQVVRVYTRQILAGLAYLHARGIVHRDVKGANILVDTGSGVKLADFGASKRIEGLATMGAAGGGAGASGASGGGAPGAGGACNSIRGTPYWMAPEVIKGAGHGRAADVWSVGCTVVEMLSGRPPWSDAYAAPMAAMFHIASSKDPPPLPEGLSAQARDFLMRCFQRAPRERATAEELLRHPFVAEAAPAPAAAMAPAARAAPHAQQQQSQQQQSPSGRPSPLRHLPGGGSPSATAAASASGGSGSNGSSHSGGEAAAPAASGPSPLGGGGGGARQRQLEFSPLSSSRAGHLHHHHQAPPPVVLAPLQQGKPAAAKQLLQQQQQQQLAPQQQQHQQQQPSQSQDEQPQPQQQHSQPQEQEQEPQRPPLAMPNPMCHSLVACHTLPDLNPIEEPSGFLPGYLAGGPGAGGGGRGGGGGGHFGCFAEEDEYEAALEEAATAAAAAAAAAATDSSDEGPRSAGAAFFRLGRQQEEQRSDVIALLLPPPSRRSDNEGDAGAADAAMEAAAEAAMDLARTQGRPARRLTEAGNGVAAVDTAAVAGAVAPSPAVVAVEDDDEEGWREQVAAALSPASPSDATRQRALRRLTEAGAGVARPERAAPDCAPSGVDQLLEARAAADAAAADAAAADADAEAEAQQPATPILPAAVARLRLVTGGASSGGGASPEPPPRCASADSLADHLDAAPRGALDSPRGAALVAAAAAAAAAYSAAGSPLAGGMCSPKRSPSPRRAAISAGGAFGGAASPKRGATPLLDSRKGLLDAAGPDAVAAAGDSEPASPSRLQRLLAPAADTCGRDRDDALAMTMWAIEQQR